MKIGLVDVKTGVEGLGEGRILKVFLVSKLSLFDANFGCFFDLNGCGVFLSTERKCPSLTPPVMSLPQADPDGLRVSGSPSCKDTVYLLCPCPRVVREEGMYGVPRLCALGLPTILLFSSLVRELFIIGTARPWHPQSRKRPGTEEFISVSLGRSRPLPALHLLVISSPKPCLRSTRLLPQQGRTPPPPSAPEDWLLSSTFYPEILTPLWKKHFITHVQLAPNEMMSFLCLMASNVCHLFFCVLS